MHAIASTTFGFAPVAANRPRSPALAEPADDAGLIGPLADWTDRFLQSLAVWGEAAGHHRLGSWTQIYSGSSVK